MPGSPRADPAAGGVSPVSVVPPPNPLSRPSAIATSPSETEAAAGRRVERGGGSGGAAGRRRRLVRSRCPLGGGGVGVTGGAHWAALVVE